jgi:hypothetical protein
MPIVRRARLTVLAASLAFAAVALSGRGASAQLDGGTVTATAFDPSDFFIGIQATVGGNLSDFDVARFFNKARCDCSQTVWVYVALLPSGIAKVASVQAAAPSGRIEFWVGTQCNVAFNRDQNCQQIGPGSMSLASFILNGPQTLQTNARLLSTYPPTGVGTTIDGGTTGTVFPPGGNPDCTDPTQSSTGFAETIWVLVSNTGSQTYDTTVQRNIQIDLTPPPEPDPTTVTVSGGDQALVVGWQKLDTAIYTDLVGYQILCTRGDPLGDPLATPPVPPLQVFNTGAFAPGFTSADSLVASRQVMGSMCADTALGVGIPSLDPAFVCSPLLSTSATSYRVKILQNDIVYAVSVVSVDNSGNATQPPDIFYGTPIKTKSFYDVYRDGNTGSIMPYPQGAATGGFCSVATARPGRGGALAAGALALVGVAIAVARRRRRR